MGKVAEQADQLQLLLNGVSNGTKKADIDNPPVPIKKKPGRPRKNIDKVEFLGLAVPEKIMSVVNAVKSMLESAGKYSEALDFAIYNCAIQLYVYNNLVTNMLSQKQFVATRELTTTSETLRRSLEALGLNMNKKTAGVSTDEANNPLVDLLTQLNDSNKESEIVSKPKKKQEV